MAWSLRNRAIVLVATALFVVFGVRAARSLPIDAVPDLTNVQVQIITTAPALSPVEVEQYVTVAVERAMAGIPHASDVRSISKYGLSVVTVVFDEGTNIYFARQLVGERMREAEEAVPSSYGRPEMGPITTALGEIYQFVVRGDGYSLMQLEEILDWYISPQLRTVRGVVESNSFGGENKEYQVVLDPQRLQASSVSVREVEAALERSNANAGGGYIERNREQIVIGTYGIVDSLDDLETAVVGVSKEGTPITIANIGEVRYGGKLKRGAASMNGEGEVCIGVALMLKGENSRTVTEAVKAKVESMKASLPKGVRIEPFYDRAELVNRTIHTVVKNLAEGAALVVIVLFLLLGDLRAGLVVAVTIPLAMLFALILMNLTGVSGNLMSLGAIDFGLIVDAAVIIVENAVRRLGEKRREKGSDLTEHERIEVIRDAAIQVRAASVFGEAIIAIVYLPILTLRGIEGKLFQPMATTVLFAIGGAFVLSMTVVPVLASYMLRSSTTEHEAWLMRKAHAAYRPVLARVLRHRALTLTIGIALLAGGFALFTQLGAEFVPTLDEGDLLIEARRLPGISLSESLATEKRLQKAVLAVPEIDQVISRTGAPEVATDPMGLEQSDVYVLLKPHDQWRGGMTKATIAEDVSKAIAEAVPEVSGAISQPIQMRTNELVAGARSDVAVQVYGPQLPKLQELGDEVAAAVKHVRGAVDVRATQAGGLRYLRIVPDRARLARYGLAVEDVNLLTEMIAVGHRAGVIFEGDRRFDLMVKLKPITGDVDAIRALPLESTNLQAVPLGDVADVSIETGPSLVNRDQQSRRLTVEFNVRGRDLVSAVGDARRAVAAAVQLPTGYRIEWGGEFQNFISARRRLIVVVPLALALIVFMLWLAFGAVRPAILVFLNIPFAIIGGVGALWIRDIPFSISAGVGFIALFGVAVLNGLVLVSFTRHLEQEGATPADAVAKAAELRLRPVLMTALVASLGFLPMALSHAPGSEVQRPLATVVIGGLVTATALTLALFPAVYALAAPRARRKPGVTS
jgi:cobalt-zinc-cadmium resistance protein CzcA